MAPQPASPARAAPPPGSGRWSCWSSPASPSSPRDRAETLSYGQRKLLELSYVLIADPEIILLDEPAGGVNPTLIGTISERIRELNRQGTTFLIVEHNMEFVMGLCDQVTVLDNGTPVVSGPPDVIRNDHRVLDAYLGRQRKTMTAPQPGRRRARAPAGSRRWFLRARGDRCGRRLRRRRRPARSIPAGDGRRHHLRGGAQRGRASPPCCPRSAGCSGRGGERSRCTASG